MAGQPQRVNDIHAVTRFAGVSTPVVRARRRPTRGGGSQALLEQRLFRDALTRQCRQADRFERPFGLLLIVGRAWHGTSQWAPVANVLTASAQETDVVGWFEENSVIGVIRWGVSSSDSPAALRDGVEREIERRIGAVAMAGVCVRAYLYSPQSESLGTPFVDAVVTHRAPGRLGPVAKRALDVVGSAALLLAVAPIMLTIAALVKMTSRGPVFFRQQRIGEQGRPFSMLKFRTMRVDAGHDIHQQFVAQYIQGQMTAGDATSNAAPIFKIVADPRVTRVGHFLRRSSLDELPQFWNVLRGEMSLVGPRPPLPYEVKIYKPWHWRRVLEAKPGITGLWQVNGRSRTTFDDMVRLDIRYARDQSVWMDVRILLATPRAVVSGSGAH